MPGSGAERPAVEDPLLGYAEDIGWIYLPPDEALKLRRGASGWLLDVILRGRLIALNPGVVYAGNTDEIIGRLESVRCTIEGNAEILKWLRGEHSIHSEDEKRRRNVMRAVDKMKLRCYTNLNIPATPLDREVDAQLAGFFFGRP